MTTIKDDAGLGRLPYHRSATMGHLSSGGALQGIASDDNLNVAWVTAGVPGATERLNFIVKAVNCHAELIAALTTLLDEADGFNVSGVYFGEEARARAAIDAARAALACAE